MKDVRTTVACGKSDSKSKASPKCGVAEQHRVGRAIAGIQIISRLTLLEKTFEFKSSSTLLLLIIEFYLSLAAAIPTSKEEKRPQK
jgi:hypothetical protein